MTKADWKYIIEGVICGIIAYAAIIAVMLIHG